MAPEKLATVSTKSIEIFLFETAVAGAEATLTAVVFINCVMVPVYSAPSIPAPSILTYCGNWFKFKSVLSSEAKKALPVVIIVSPATVVASVALFFAATTCIVAKSEGKIDMSVYNDPNAGSLSSSIDINKQ